MDPINLSDFERAARERMPRMAFDYYASGADDESTLSENRTAFARLKLAYRVLVDVSRRDLSTTVLGHPVSMPVLVSPTAFHKLACEEGETASVRATGAAGTIFTLSTLSNTAVEEVCAAATGPVWFQLYVYKDRGATEGLVRRAEEAGCSALVLTVDAPLLGKRERDIRNRFHLPEGLKVENMLPRGYGEVAEESGASGLAAYVDSLMDQALTWRDLDWLRSVTRLPILVKGIVRPDDALRAVEHGAAGIVVSNHGGRQLDTSIATVEALPGIVDALETQGAQAEVLIDGGVRRGTDVIKALALGAKAVMVGRPVLWGLAVDGEEGVTRVLEMLRVELDRAMALCGCPTVESVTRDLVWGG